MLAKRMARMSKAAQTYYLRRRRLRVIRARWAERHTEIEVALATPINPGKFEKICIFGPHWAENDEELKWYLRGEEQWSLRGAVYSGTIEWRDRLRRERSRY